MIDLGKYAGTVLSAYAVTLILLAAIIAITYRSHKRAKARLNAIEARKDA